LFVAHATGARVGDFCSQLLFSRCSCDYRTAFRVELAKPDLFRERLDQFVQGAVPIRHRTVIKRTHESLRLTQPLEVGGPTTKRISAVIEVQSAIVHSGDSALGWTAYMIDYGLHHVRRDGEPLIHNRHHAAAQIMQGPSRQGRVTAIAA
jgi:hypothetical protein